MHLNAMRLATAQNGHLVPARAVAMAQQAVPALRQALYDRGISRW
jgi:hypothetical protein